MVGTQETRGVAPPPGFVEQANVSDPSIYGSFEQNWPSAWRRVAGFLDWERAYDTVCGSAARPPYRRWFGGGTLNAAENCVDRHVSAGRGSADALRWNGRDGTIRTYSYADLKREVTEMAAVLRGLGVEAGDPVALYLPSIPALPIGMLAAARLGAPHVVVSPEHSGAILAEVVSRSGARTVVTCAGYSQDGERCELASRIQPDLDGLDGPVTVVAVTHDDDESETPGSSHRYETLRELHRREPIEPVARESHDPLFFCYEVGANDEPVGTMHATGEYLANVAWTTYAVLDAKPDDTLWSSASIEWVIGHSYSVYGPLALGATTVLYEGANEPPDRHRPWEIIAENGVTQFYTTSNAIRLFRNWGRSYPAAHDLSSLRLLGAVGDSVEPRTWKWFYEHVGGADCPIVDTWGQTETGGITLSTLPGVCEMKPGWIGPPLPGLDVAVVDPDGAAVGAGEAGYLVFHRPWPGLCRPVDRRDERELSHRWDRGDTPSEWTYCSEHGVVVDHDRVRVLGQLATLTGARWDSKDRIYPAEIERTIGTIDGVAQVAVVPADRADADSVTYAFIVLSEEVPRTDHDRIRDTIEGDLPPSMRPDTVYTVPELPRTASGSVLRRVLADVLNRECLGDTRLLRNPESLEHIAAEIRSEADVELD